MKRFKIMPDSPSGYPLSRYIFEVVKARAARNLVTNPSIEIDATNWTAVGGTIARSAAWQRYGAYSLLITPTAGVNDGAYYGGATPLAFTPGLYFASIWGKFAPGLNYKMYFATTGGVQVGNRVAFKGLGRPQRVVVPYYEQSTASRRIYITKNNHANTRPFYLDGLQAEVGRATDYLDGSLLGFVPNENAYIWDGAEHASTSRRSANTRSGGEAVPLAKYYFTLMAIMGLGIHPPENVATPLSMIGGSIYQRTIPASERVFDIVGDFRLQDADELDEMIEKLTEAITYANSATQQPILLRCHMDEPGAGKYSEVAEIPCVYQGGLEGERSSRVQAGADIRFKTYLPVIRRQGHEGAQLQYFDNISAGRFIRRSPDGSWGSAGGGVTGGWAVGASVLPNGKMVVFGNFTAAGGVANTRLLALYDPLTDSFSSMGGGASGGFVVSGVAISPDGLEATIVGDFTSLGGAANTDSIGVYNFPGNAYASISSGFTGAGFTAIAYRPNGNIIAGGSFSVINGTVVSNIAEYDGSSWVALGTPGGNIGGQAIYATNNTDLVAGLDTIIGALVGWDGLAWTVLVPTVEDARAFSVAEDGSLYFLEVNVLTSTKFWRYNGFAGTQIFDISGAIGLSTYHDPRTGLIYLSGTFGEIQGALSPSIFWAYTGGPAGTFRGVDFESGTTLVPTFISSGKDGSLYFGIPDDGNIRVSHTNIVTNSGSADGNPTAVMVGPSRLWQLENISTGNLLYFNLELLDGERATLELLHDSIRFYSNFRGDLSDTILPGSGTGVFHLAPGANLVNVFMTPENTSTAPEDSPEMSMWWTVNYSALTGIVK